MFHFKSNRHKLSKQNNLEKISFFVVVSQDCGITLLWCSAQTTEVYRRMAAMTIL